MIPYANDTEKNFGARSFEPRLGNKKRTLCFYTEGFFLCRVIDRLRFRGRHRQLHRQEQQREQESGL